MNDVEWLELVNERDEVIGSVTRDEAWARRLPVRGVNAFLVNSRGELWIPRRTLHKRMFPGCLDMSVGGHVWCGESYEAAFRRAYPGLPLPAIYAVLLRDGWAS